LIGSRHRDGLSQAQHFGTQQNNATLRITPTIRAEHPGASPMIRCHLSELMRQHKLRTTELARLTGLNRSTISALCHNTATRVELPAIERLCAVFNCEVGDLFKRVPDSLRAPE
jgi:putative transcriptional regulator